MAQPDTNLEFKIPPYLDKTGKLEMTVKMYWTRFNTYLFIILKIRIEPLLKKEVVVKKTRKLKMKMTKTAPNWH